MLMVFIQIIQGAVFLMLNEAFTLTILPRKLQDHAWYK